MKTTWTVVLLALALINVASTCDGGDGALSTDPGAGETADMPEFPPSNNIPEPVDNGGDDNKAEPVELMLVDALEQVGSELSAVAPLHDEAPVVRLASGLSVELREGTLEVRRRDQLVASGPVAMPLQVKPVDDGVFELELRYDAESSASELDESGWVLRQSASMPGALLVRVSLDRTRLETLLSEGLFSVSGEQAWGDDMAAILGGDVTGQGAIELLRAEVTAQRPRTEVPADYCSRHRCASLAVAPTCESLPLSSIDPFASPRFEFDLDTLRRDLYGTPSLRETATMVTLIDQLDRFAALDCASVDPQGDSFEVALPQVPLAGLRFKVDTCQDAPSSTLADYLDTRSGYRDLNAWYWSLKDALANNGGNKAYNGSPLLTWWQERLKDQLVLVLGLAPLFVDDVLRELDNQVLDRQDMHHKLISVLLGAVLSAAPEGSGGDAIAALVASSANAMALVGRVGLEDEIADLLRGFLQLGIGEEEQDKLLSAAVALHPAVRISLEAELATLGELGTISSELYASFGEESHQALREICGYRQALEALGTATRDELDAINDQVDGYLLMLSQDAESLSCDEASCSQSLPSGTFGVSVSSW